MKKNWDSFVLPVILVMGVLLLTNVLSEHWKEQGAAKVRAEMNQQMDIFLDDFKSQFKAKDDVIAKVVKEKLDAIDNSDRKLRVLRNEFTKYKQDVQENFNKTQTRITQLETENKNLLADKKDLQNAIGSFSSANRDIITAWSIADEILLSRYDGVLKETVGSVEEKYIAFVNKIDRVKKSVRHKR